MLPTGCGADKNRLGSLSRTEKTAGQQRRQRASLNRANVDLSTKSGWRTKKAFRVIDTRKAFVSAEKQVRANACHHGCER